jgi:tetratricopeptide (TPR) repeat protein
MFPPYLNVGRRPFSFACVLASCLVNPAFPAWSRFCSQALDVDTAEDGRVALCSLPNRKAGERVAEEAAVIWPTRDAPTTADTPERHEPRWMFADNVPASSNQSDAALEATVMSYRAKLRQLTRERAPLDWAETQNNLGKTLQALGERDSGTARLEEAVAAYRAALTERSRERNPYSWAATQNNLGTALSALGQQESDTARLQQAVDAYREALKEYTRERWPGSWAMTQNNLGSALLTLGERKGDTARLEEAVAAYREALKEATRDRMPEQSANIQRNLETALRHLGEPKQR